MERQARCSFVSVLPGRNAGERSRTRLRRSRRSRTRSQTTARASSGRRNEEQLRRRTSVHARHRDGRNDPARRRPGRHRTRGGSAQFQTASSDGSRVFFTDKQRLTPDSTAEPAVAGKADLYECEIDRRRRQARLLISKDLTVERNAGEHAACRASCSAQAKTARASTSSPRACSPSNENGNGETAEAGRDNLYELHSTARNGRRRSSRGSRAKTAPSGKATTAPTRPFCTAACLPERSLPGVHVGGEPDRL